MTVPYRAHVNERTLLNLPGFHSGAFVYVYVEDTRERGLRYGEYCEPGCLCGCVDNFEPQLRLELSDCDRRISLKFDLDSEGYRENSLHKLDTLVAALRVFRKGARAGVRAVRQACEGAPGAEGAPGGRPG